MWTFATRYIRSDSCSLVVLVLNVWLLLYNCVCMFDLILCVCVCE